MKRMALQLALEYMEANQGFYDTPRAVHGVLRRFTPVRCPIDPGLWVAAEATGRCRVDWAKVGYDSPDWLFNEGTPLQINYGGRRPARRNG